jgi:chromosome segregation ATPase
MSTLVEQLSVLERYGAWQREGKKPQLAFYRYKQWEQLFIYSYSPNSLSEIPHYLLTTITHYVSYLLGRVDFDSTRIESQKESLRNRAITHIYTFGEHSSRDLIKKLESNISTLSSREQTLQKNIGTLETRKVQLISETTKLDAQTKEGLEKEIKKLKAKTRFHACSDGGSQRKIKDLEKELAAKKTELQKTQASLSTCRGSRRKERARYS